MPLYEFSCSSCEQDFEYLVRGSDWKTEVHCPSCGQSKPDRLHKKMSAPSVAVASGAGMDMPACSGNPGSCGRCSTN